MRDTSFVGTDLLAKYRVRFVEAALTVQYYRIYVRLKGGGQATGRDLHTGPPPDHGTLLDVPLITGRIVKARIGSRSKGGKRKGVAGRATTDVYAHEI